MALDNSGASKGKGMCPAHTSLGALVEVRQHAQRHPLEKAEMPQLNLTKAPA